MKNRLLYIFLPCVTLLAFSPSVSARSPEELAGKLDHAVALANVLVKGVDECFNPKYKDAIAGTKAYFTNLGALFLNFKRNALSGDKRSMQADSEELRATLTSFAERAPFPANLTCATKRACMEMGFEGNARYPRCLPVNGDIRANLQFRSFQELADKEMPAILALLLDAAR